MSTDPITNQSETLEFIAETSGERLDKLVATQATMLSRATVQRLIKSGQVTVNGCLSKPSYRVEPGDRIGVCLPQESEPELLPESLSLDVLYEDEYLLVVNKPPGMVVHPGAGHRSGTLVNALLGRYPQIVDVCGLERAGIVHRLDKDTSGVIVIAKTEPVCQALQRQFKKRRVRKTYLALVEGHPNPRRGVIEAPIGRDKRQRKQMAIVRSGREARTAYQVIELFDDNSLVEVRPETGRTHQIRIHLAWLGYPVVGDQVYGYRKRRLPIQRQFLHAHKLELEHPVTGESLTLTAPLASDLVKLLRQLRRS